MSHYHWEMNVTLPSLCLKCHIGAKVCDAMESRKRRPRDGCRDLAWMCKTPCTSYSSVVSGYLITDAYRASFTMMSALTLQNVFLPSMTTSAYPDVMSSWLLIFAECKKLNIASASNSNKLVIARSTMLCSGKQSIVPLLATLELELEEKPAKPTREKRQRPRQRLQPLKIETRVLKNNNNKPAKN